MIDDLIIAEQYHLFPGTSVTVCCLTLKNGFHVIGYSASLEGNASKSGARKNAREQIWRLEGYLQKQREYENEL